MAQQAQFEKLKEQIEAAKRGLTEMSDTEIDVGPEQDFSSSAPSNIVETKQIKIKLGDLPSNDTINTKVVDIIYELDRHKMDVDIIDPWCSGQEANKEYDLNLKSKPDNGNYDAILLTVAHKQFFDMGVDKIKQLGRENHVIYDLKSMFDKTQTDIRL